MVPCIRVQNRSNAASGSIKISRNRNFLHNLQENKLGKAIWFWHFIQNNFEIILRNQQFRSFFQPLLFCRRQKNLKDEQEWRNGAGNILKRFEASNLVKFAKDRLLNVKLRASIDLCDLAAQLQFESSRNRRQEKPQPWILSYLSPWFGLSLRPNLISLYPKIAHVWPLRVVPVANSRATSAKSLFSSHSRCTRYGD